jgi:hypothetical protein
VMGSIGHVARANSGLRASRGCADGLIRWGVPGPSRCPGSKALPSPHQYWAHGLLSGFRAKRPSITLSTSKRAGILLVSGRLAWPKNYFVLEQKLFARSGRCLRGVFGDFWPCS